MEATAPTPPDPARRSLRARRAILDATSQLIAEKGYADVTIEAIAARAGVGKPTIYRWWPSKAMVTIDLLIEIAEQTTGYADTGDLAADLRTQMQGLIAAIHPPRTSPLAGVIAEGLHNPDVARQLRNLLLEPQLELFKDRLRRAQQHGQLSRDADPDVALYLLYGPLHYRLLYDLGMPDARELDALIARALNAMNGPAELRPAPGSA
ncbi:TetR/AcrR family transcriptional regulator [Nocardia panacis]|uniref:TetR/AcrR family transcriptional regulator n=1 Tax=Nocardia panacis TaxID=2340916 RepID=A0A3A4KD28_9NOCA|nr:TetR/AcrR family transcriptional regulator [Nocardia panacis]RJO73345.1 TetR/AcrR family transcriptional regulator [Nocardia panacis]